MLYDVEMVRDRASVPGSRIYSGLQNCVPRGASEGGHAGMFSRGIPDGSGLWMNPTIAGTYIFNLKGEMCICNLMQNILSKGYSWKYLRDSTGG